MPRTTPGHVDVAVIGGGPAGTTAALVLARARRSVLQIDDRTYRNRAVAEFHGFPTRDRTAPAAFLADAHAELDRYGVDTVGSGVVRAQAVDAGASLELADGRRLTASAVVLATGVRDELPPIEGLAERWGRSAFNCPFCDGWEHRDRPVAVIDAAPGAEHLADLLRAWTDDVTVLAAADVARLEGPGTALERIVLTSGRTVAVDAVFVKAPVAPRSQIASDLGCAVDPHGYVITDADGRSSNRRVWCAGDVRRAPPAAHQVVTAAGDGSAAAIAVQKAFVAGELACATRRRPVLAGRRR